MITAAEMRKLPTRKRSPLKAPFAPPREPIKVRCLHCGKKYESDSMVWHGGLWWCSTPKCDGAGFGFDIHRAKVEEV